MINYSIGLRIQELRTANNLSQSQLAMLAGITPTYLNMIERDEKNPTVYRLSKICRGLNISLSEFFDDEYRVENPEINRIVAELNKLDESKLSEVLTFIKRMNNNGR